MRVRKVLLRMRSSREAEVTLERASRTDEEGKSDAIKTAGSNDRWINCDSGSGLITGGVSLFLDRSNNEKEGEKAG